MPSQKILDAAEGRADAVPVVGGLDSLGMVAEDNASLLLAYGCSDLDPVYETVVRSVDDRASNVEHCLKYARPLRHVAPIVRACGVVDRGFWVINEGDRGQARLKRCLVWFAVFTAVHDDGLSLAIDCTILTHRSRYSTT